MIKAYRSYIRICAHPECGEYTENRMVDFCATHQRAFRKESENEKKQAEKRAQMIEKQKARNDKPRMTISKVSEKRKGLNQEYATLRPQYLLEHPDCEVKLIGCEGASVEIHHTYSGSNKVAHLNDTATWKASCAHCHGILHDKLSAKESRELGLKI